MRHITVTVEEETYRQIRIWCAGHDTCVSPVVQAFLRDLPRLEDVRVFPLPDAPDPASLGAHFDGFHQAGIEAIQRRISECGWTAAAVFSSTVSLSRRITLIF